MGKVLSFSQYHKINEQEEMSASAQAADAILDVFFSLYGAVVPKIGGYNDAVKDIQSLGRIDDITKMGPKMEEIIKNVSGKMAPVYAMGKNVNKLGTSISKAWAGMMEDEVISKESDKVKESARNKIDSYLQNLVSNFKKNESEGTEEIGGVLLLERIVWEERQQAKNELKTFAAEMKSILDRQKGVDETKEYQDACKAAYDKVQGFLADLEDDKWEPLKRRKKKEKLDEIAGDLTQLKTSIQTAQQKNLAKIGLDIKIRSSITDLQTQLKGIQEEMERVYLDEVEKTESGEDKKDEDSDKPSGGGTKASDFKEIKVGGENAKKKGKANEEIKSFQTLYNTINPRRKIAVDGIFGRADGTRGETENAVDYVAKLVWKLTNEKKFVTDTKEGTVITPEIQAAAKILIDKVMPFAQKEFATIGTAEKGKEGKEEDQETQDEEGS